jgi:putative endonuclease
MILCENGSFYTGYTKDIEVRFSQHKKGLGARYTRINRPKRVVHVEKFTTRVEAVRREREIKSMTHKMKLKLAR